jgi:hypothetical protein
VWYYSGAFNLGIRDAIGAWLVCLAVAAAFFGYPLVTAAPAVQHDAATDRPLVSAPAKIGTRHSLSVESPQG